MKKLALCSVIVALAVVGCGVWGLLFCGLGTLASNGINYMAEQHGLLLFYIVIIGTISVVAYAACRNPKK